MHTLTICSYNMHGYNQGELFMRNNLNKFDICCIQEHCVGFSACVLFNTPGPLLHLGPPGPGPLANPGGRYPTMDG